MMALHTVTMFMMLPSIRIYQVTACMPVLSHLHAAPVTENREDYRSTRRPGHLVA